MSKKHHKIENKPACFKQQAGFSVQSVLTIRSNQIYLIVGEFVRIIRYLLLGLLGIVIVVFTLLNAQPITINMLFTSLTLPLPLLLCFSLLVGILLGALVGLAAYWKAKQQCAHRLRHQRSIHVPGEG